MKKRTKILIVLFLLFYLYFNLVMTKGIEKDVYYIPENYIGLIKIFTSQKDGQSKEYIGDRRLYKIGQDGILKSQFSVGLMTLREKGQMEFYYVDKLGNRTKKLERLVFTYNNDSLLNEVVVAFSGLHAMGTNGSIVVLLYQVDTLKNFKNPKRKQPKINLDGY